jgi:hypothetical protein
LEARWIHEWLVAGLRNEHVFAVVATRLVARVEAELMHGKNVLVFRVKTIETVRVLVRISVLLVVDAAAAADAFME